MEGESLDLIFSSSSIFVPHLGRRRLALTEKIVLAIVRTGPDFD
jgi:hypothetical protein